jgi:hypothetical protein
VAGPALVAHHSDVIPGKTMRLNRFSASRISRSIGVGSVCVLALCASGCMDGSMKEPPSEVRADGALEANRDGLLATNSSSTGFLIEQMVRVAAFLVRSYKGDGDFAAGKDHAFQAFADFSQREIIVEMHAEFG